MSGGNVVEFPDPKQFLWVCDCGCASWYLGADGGAKCCVCEAVLTVEGQGWYEEIRDGHDRDPDLPAPVRDINGNGSEEFALRRMRQLVEHDDCIALVVIRDEGQVSTWNKAETESQLDWLLERLEQAIDMIKAQDRLDG